jgi:hypothetical protein
VTRVALLTVRGSPKGTIASACWAAAEAKAIGGLDVEHGFVFRRSLRREVGWFLAFQDAVDVGGGRPIQGGLINPEGDQSAFGEETAEVWDRMEP